MGKLYIIATPIGNMKDLGFRALEILKSVDLIACEDTRVTRKLLARYGITCDLISCHDHNEIRSSGKIIDKIRNGSSVGLVSDAGTPLISDPGYRVIQRALEEDIAFDVIPGPSAVVNALVLSGFPAERFVFLGFLPRKPGKISKLLDQAESFSGTAVLYESVHRIEKTVRMLAERTLIRRIAIIREMTKVHQEVLRGDKESILKKMAHMTRKGEFCVVFTSEKKHMNLKKNSKGILEWYR